MLDNGFHAWKAIPNTCGIRKVFHKNFKPSQIYKSEINLYPKFYHRVLGDLREKFSRERSGQSVSLLNHLKQGLLP